MVTTFLSTSVANPTVYALMMLPVSVAALGVLVRCGLLSFIAFFVMALVLSGFPITYDVTTWYWAATAVGLGAMAAITVYGVVVSVGGWRNLARVDSTAG